MNITMIGTGYVGLVSGTCFAEMGFNVTCVDIDAEKIRQLSEEAMIPIYEPGLEEMVKSNIDAERLHFTTDLAACVPNSDAVFIAVGTPQDEDGSADMKYVLAAAEQIAPHLNDFTVIVNKSTVPVGTAARVDAAMRAVNGNADFEVVSNPEFLREGNAIGDFMKPDRIVVGAKGEKARTMMERLYKPQTDQGFKLMITDPTSSEMIKYAANAFLAMKITFINELAALAEVTGADIQEIAAGIGSDSRIGEKFLQAGPGYGGSCFPKDTNAIAKIAQDAGSPLTLIEQTITANQAIKERMVGLIEKACGGSVAGKRVGVLGLAFKAQTDDMRDAPALTILPKLIEKGAVVQAFDPEAHHEAARLLPEVQLQDTGEAVAQGAGVLVILTEWAEFKELDYISMAKKMTSANLVDLRHLLTAEEAEKAGFSYARLGC